MRSFRWLLLVAIAVIAAGVIQVYRLERKQSRAAQRPNPPALAIGDAASADNWEWAGPGVDLRAKHYRLSADSKIVQLEGIELRIYQKNGNYYDRVRTDHASFSNDDNKLFAPGEAEITLDVPMKGDPKHSLTTIKAAGISYNSQTGEAVTDQHVTFAFENGQGICDGASYNPKTHEIHLMHSVVLNLKGQTPQSRPMKVEAGELIYSETASTVRLGPWSRMTRDQTVMNAGPALVTMKNRKLDSIEAPAAHGVDVDQAKGRNLEYSGDQMKAQYNEHGEIEKLDALGNAKLVSHARGSDTTMTGNRLDLFFTGGEKDSVLTSAQARGNAVLESKPSADPKGLTPDTKNLRSDAVDIFMKPDGRDLDHVATLAPGTLEFVPNQAARSRRLVKADRMQVRYGAGNEIQAFHADAASTETYPSQAEKESLSKNKKPAPSIAYTSSKAMDAAFDEKGLLKQIQETGNFRYSEGVRKAQSDTATMDNAKNVMDLDAHARVSDDLGSTAANHIRLNQATDEFDARGNVATTRQPEQKPGADKGGMLDPGEAMQGKADHVVSASHGSVIHYIDHAVVWQGASRISADKIDIERDKKTLTAEGNVVSQLEDSAKPGPNGKPVASPMTLVRSQKMVYTDANRLAVYSGGATMTRVGLIVKCATLQAFMNDGKPVDGKTPDSRIDHALADGKVEIVQMAAARQRVGTGEHGEFVTSEGKVTLTGGNPQLKDSVKGDSSGEILTYFTGDDRLLINGAPKKQVEGHILRGKS